MSRTLHRWRDLAIHNLLSSSSNRLLCPQCRVTQAVAAATTTLANSTTNSTKSIRICTRNSTEINIFKTKSCSKSKEGRRTTQLLSCLIRHSNSNSNRYKEQNRTTRGTTTTAGTTCRYGYARTPSSQAGTRSLQVWPSLRSHFSTSSQVAEQQLEEVSSRCNREESISCRRNKR